MATSSSGSGEATRPVSPAKLSPHVQHVAEVRRLRLSDSLARAGASKLVLVGAPAGFGKTTTMAQMRESLRQRGVATAWLTLDSADNDVARFLSALEAAVVQLGIEGLRDCPHDVLALLAAEQAPFALFFDDFEALRDGVVMGVVRELIEHLPRNGQLVIGSRRQPELGLGRLRARGQLLELGTDLLRFTPEETAEFFKLRGADLSLDALDRAHDKTEGWAAALWLLSLTLQKPGAPGDVVARLSASERDIADYLTEEVLGQQDREVRDFLMRTSVLRHLSAPICRALLPHTDCDGMLRRLVRGNVFLIPVEDSLDLYRYHSLFADFLRKRLAREQPDEVARLHLAASGWYEEQGRPVPAIDHALEGGDHPHALHLLELHANALLEQGRMRLLDRWFTSIPARLVRERPRMQVIAVWASCLSQGPWIAMESLEASGCARSEDAVVQAHVCALRPVLLAMMDRYGEAREAGRLALAQLPSGSDFIDSVTLNAMAHIVSISDERQEALRFLEDARRSQGSSAFNRMYTETVEGMLDMREGRLKQAAARFRMAIASSSPSATYNYAHGNAWAGVPYAAIVYEENDLGTAERLLNVYLPLARDVGLPDHMILSYRLRSRIAFERGDVDAAIQTLIELDYLGHQRKLPRVTASAKLERARLLALQGHASAAREELSRVTDPSTRGATPEQLRPAQDVDDLFIARVRVELGIGSAAALVAPLEEQIRQAQKTRHLHRALKLRLLLSLAFFKTGATDAALDMAVAVLREACSEGYVRLVLDEASIAGPMLRSLYASTAIEVHQDPVFRDYLQRLVDLLGPAPVEGASPVGVADEATAELLTRKEIRVLRLIAEGYSNTAMAEKLFVSDSTVRTHLRNINTKLGCHSRTQAIAIARRLGIIQ